MVAVICNNKLMSDAIGYGHGLWTGQGNMIGVVLVTHGRLADEFVAALEHVVGSQQQIETVNMGADDEIEKCRQEIIDKVKRADTGDGVVLVTDMFGGTPSNLAISVMEKYNVEVIAGANLPMLIKLASVRETCSLADAAQAAQDAGRKYVNLASSLLANRSC